MSTPPKSSKLKRWLVANFGKKPVPGTDYVEPSHLSQVLSAMDLKRQISKAIKEKDNMSNPTTTPATTAVIKDQPTIMTVPTAPVPSANSTAINVAVVVSIVGTIVQVLSWIWPDMITKDIQVTATTVFTSAGVWVLKWFNKRKAAAAAKATVSGLLIVALGLVSGGMTGCATGGLTASSVAILAPALTAVGAAGWAAYDAHEKAVADKENSDKAAAEALAQAKFQGALAIVNPILDRVLPPSTNKVTIPAGTPKVAP